MAGIVCQDYHRILAANAYFRRPFVPQVISRFCDYECDEMGLVHVVHEYWGKRDNQGKFLQSVEMRDEGVQPFPRCPGFRYKQSSLSLLVPNEAAEG